MYIYIYSHSNATLFYIPNSIRCKIKPGQGNANGTSLENSILGSRNLVQFLLFKIIYRDVFMQQYQEA